MFSFWSQSASVKVGGSKKTRSPGEGKLERYDTDRTEGDLAGQGLLAPGMFRYYIEDLLVG